MRHSTRYRLNTFFSASNFPQGVKWLLISNTAVFVLGYLLGQAGFPGIFNRWFALVPREVVFHFAIWQLATYLFLHGGVGHLLFNMLALWMFGVTLERDWGTRKFLKYYFLCGIGAGLCDVTVNALLGNWYTSTIGASGAIYGVLLAFGVLYPEAIILFMFIFPIQAKYFVMIVRRHGAVGFSEYEQRRQQRGAPGRDDFRPALPEGAFPEVGYVRGAPLVPQLQDAARQEEIPGVHAEAWLRPWALGETESACPTS
jgi:membrane associated rhomboid family serine protease